MPESFHGSDEQRSPSTITDLRRRDDEILSAVEVRLSGPSRVNVLLSDYRPTAMNAKATQEEKDASRDYFLKRLEALNGELKGAITQETVFVKSIDGKKISSRVNYSIVGGDGSKCVFASITGEDRNLQIYDPIPQRASENVSYPFTNADLKRSKALSQKETEAAIIELSKAEKAIEEL